MSERARGIEEDAQKKGPQRFKARCGSVRNRRCRGSCRSLSVEPTRSDDGQSLDQLHQGIDRDRRRHPITPATLNSGLTSRTIFYILTVTDT